MGKIIAVLVKIIILAPLFLIQVMLKLGFLVIIFAVLLFVSVVYGIVCHSFMMICDEEDMVKKLLMFIFLPFTMIWSVFINLREFFRESVVEVAGGICASIVVNAFWYFRW